MSCEEAERGREGFVNARAAGALLILRAARGIWVRRSMVYG